MSLTILQSKEIAEVFETLGFNKKDQTVYVALLGLPPTTLTPLARLVRLPVTTVQSVLARLETFGVVNVTKRKSRHVYEALEPGALQKLMERRLEEVVGIVPLLSSLIKDAGGSSNVKVFYRERMNDIFNAALEAKGKMVYEIVSAADIQKILGEKFHFSRRRIAASVRLKSLRVESREIKNYNREIDRRELREARFLPREFSFQASVYFWDTTTALFSTTEEGVAVLIESRTITDMFRQMFEMLWSVSRLMDVPKA